MTNGDDDGCTSPSMDAPITMIRAAGAAQITHSLNGGIANGDAVSVGVRLIRCSFRCQAKCCTQVT